MRSQIVFLLNDLQSHRIFINGEYSRDIKHLELRIKDSSFPRASIVIINYNGHRWLKLFMPYFIRTQYPDFEIIVVDNGSTDQSVKYLKDNFRNIKLVELKANTGFVGGANVGARESSGKVLAFINNDMEVSQDWLIEPILKLRSDKLVAAVQCKVMQYENKNKIDVVGLSLDKYGLVHMIGHDEVDGGQYNNLNDIGACSGAAMIMWKDIFFELGGFDPVFFMYYEDVDLSWRIRLAGYKILPSISSIVYHVGSASSDITTSPFIGFHLVKNHTVCWLKNSELRTICIYWPFVLFLMIGWASFSFLNGHPSVALAQVKGILWPFLHLKYIIGERKKIKSLRKPSSRGIMKGPTNISFAIKRYKSRISDKKPSLI